MEIIILLTVVLSLCVLAYAVTDECSVAHPLSGFAALIFLAALAITISGFISSRKEAEFLNKKYNTEYTSEDIFYNSKLIHSQLKLDDKIIDNSSKIKIEMDNKK